MFRNSVKTSFNKLSLFGFDNKRTRWFGGGDDEAAQGIQQAGQQAYERSKMTGPESQQYQSSFELGKLLDQIYKYQQGLGPAPSGYLTPEAQYQQQGPLAQSYYQQALQGVQSPYAAWEETLPQQMQLAMDVVNRGAQNRGLLQSGIPIEQGSRAAAELAVANAQNRMNFRNQELARGAELSQYTQGLGAQNLANMGSLYGAQQGYGADAMKRQAAAAQNAAQYQSYPYQLQLGTSAGGQAALQALPGQALGAAGTVAGAYFNPMGTIANQLSKLGQTTGGATNNAYTNFIPDSLAAQRLQESDTTKPWRLSSGLIPYNTNY